MNVINVINVRNVVNGMWGMIIFISLLGFDMQHSDQGPVVGVIASVSRDSLLTVNGISVIEESVNNTFSPRRVTEAQFGENLKKIRSAKVKVAAANVFFPGDIKLVGPAVDERIVLGYVDTVMRRCKEAGVGIIVLGSGGSRKLPEGYDSVRASGEFISLVRKMAEVAKKYGRIIAIENLNHTETNFVLTLAEAIKYVKAVDHPNFRLTADIYHMLMENEQGSVIEQAKGLLVHAHIAEKEERAYPGKRGVDFTPYFAAMKKIGYKGKIMMECRFTDFDKQVGPAKAYLDVQLTKVRESE
ncbi:MAG TPA: sugar phosphate isomerase/epimerase family protein [Chitinophagaceae bacterium]|nr:sugar phosphate isomerase/epimerase family protein [Chitinophagaceae bacterium]